VAKAKKSAQKPGRQRLMSAITPFVDGLEAFFLAFSALGLRTSLFDFFWPFAIVSLLRCTAPP